MMELTVMIFCEILDLIDIQFKILFTLIWNLFILWYSTRVFSAGSNDYIDFRKCIYEFVFGNSAINLIFLHVQDGQVLVSHQDACDLLAALVSQFVIWYDKSADLGFA